MILLAFVFLLATTALAAECPVFEDPRFFLIPHETDCTKFYICAHGIPVLQTCPNGTHFSPMHLTCHNPVFAGCDPSFTELCPDWSLVQRPYPDSCSQYYVCQYGTVHVFDCPDGLEFNAEHQQCLWPHEANCSIPLATPEGAQADESQNGGLLQDGCQSGALSRHEECNKYYVCDNGVHVAMDCWEELQWSSKLEQCVWPHDSDCSQGVQAPGGEQVGEQVDEQVDEQVGEQGGCEDGVVSANVDCSKYNVCNHGVFLAVDCPHGLHWNSELGFCDWPVSAGCQ